MADGGTAVSRAATRKDAIQLLHTAIARLPQSYREVAEQVEPVRRKVALKIIKLGMDTKQVVARFEAERQALALMDHPNIAKVLDGGATDQGRPYFVMELVRGVPITDYCDENHVPTAERVQIFVSVCRAVQHAHQKGIIHRDLKPSNVLVTLHDGLPGRGSAESLGSRAHGFGARDDPQRRRATWYDLRGSGPGRGRVA